MSVHIVLGDHVSQQLANHRSLLPCLTLAAPDLHRDQLILRGAHERLAPILMTALTAALALAPLVYTGNLPGQEIEYPMAIVILFGLGAATLINLFVLPLLMSGYQQFSSGNDADH